MRGLLWCTAALGPTACGMDSPRPGDRSARDGDPVGCMHFDELQAWLTLTAASDPIVEDAIEMSFVDVVTASEGTHSASITTFEASSPPNSLQTRGLGFVFDFPDGEVQRITIALNHWGGVGVIGVNGSPLQEDNTFTGAGGDPVADWSWDGTTSAWAPLEIVARDGTIDTVTVGGSYTTFVDAVCGY